MHSSSSPPSKKSKQSNLKTTEITKTLSLFTLGQKNHKRKLSFLKKTPGGQNETAKQWVATTVKCMAAVQLRGMQKLGIAHTARVVYKR